MKKSAPVRRSTSLLRSLPVILTAALGFAGSAKAQIFWDGGTASGSGLGWGTAANWSTASGATTPDPVNPPGASDNVIFNITPSNSVAPCNINLGADQSAQSLTFNTAGGV